MHYTREIILMCGYNISSQFNSIRIKKQYSYGISYIATMMLISTDTVVEIVKTFLRFLNPTDIWLVINYIYYILSMFPSPVRLTIVCTFSKFSSLRRFLQKVFNKRNYRI